MSKNIEQVFEENERPLLSTVLGAGGPFAISYDSGICVGLGQKGINLREDDGPILAVSGGVWTAGFIEEGMTKDGAEKIPPVRFPNREKDYLLGIGEQVFGEARSTRIGAAVLRIPTFKKPVPRVEVLWDEDITIAEKAAAASAIPGGYRHVALKGNKYFDGGTTLSFTHAHRAPDADNLIVVAALAKNSKLSIGPLKDPGIAGRQLEWRAKTELRNWEKSNGGDANLISPTPEIGKMIERFTDLFDKKIARRAFSMAIEQAHQTVEENPSLQQLAQKMRQKSSGQ